MARLKGYRDVSPLEGGGTIELTVISDVPRPFRKSLMAGDERLARLVTAGSARAFSTLYERHHRALYRYCLSILRDEADAHDAVQSTFTRALEALRRDQRNAPLGPWLFRIAHNEAISLIRRRKADGELSVQLERQSAMVEDRAGDREQLGSLMADLQQLPERQRGALVMRELSGLSHDEIALALGTSTGGAKQAIFEARSALNEFAEGRDMGCHAVRKAISDGDRRVLRSRRVRAHLRDCAACAAFAASISDRRRRLHALAPVLAAGSLARRLGDVLRSGHAAGVHMSSGGNGFVGALANTFGVDVLSSRVVCAAIVGSAAATTVFTATGFQADPSASSGQLSSGAVYMASANPLALSAVASRPAAQRSRLRTGPNDSSSHALGLYGAALAWPTSAQSSNTAAPEPTAGLDDPTVTLLSLANASPAGGNFGMPAQTLVSTSNAQSENGSAASPSPGVTPGSSGAQPSGGGDAPVTSQSSGQAPTTAGSSGPGPGASGGGQSGGGPGDSGNAPGNSGSAPGHSGSAPGNSGSAPGHSGSAPGNSGNAPGNSGNAPGNSGNAPGHSGSAPGNSGSAPGHAGSGAGNAGAGNPGVGAANRGVATGNAGAGRPGVGAANAGLESAEAAPGNSAGGAPGNSAGGAPGNSAGGAPGNSAGGHESSRAGGPRAAGSGSSSAGDPSARPSSAAGPVSGIHDR